MGRSKTPAGQHAADDDDIVMEDASSDDSHQPIAKKRKAARKVPIGDSGQGSSRGQESPAQTVRVQRGATLPTRRASKDKGPARGASLNVVRNLKLHAPRCPSGYVFHDYRKDVRGLEQGRLFDPRSEAEKEALDYRFYTWFQQDYYHSMVYERKKTQSHILSEHKWVDWKYMKEKKDVDFDQLIQVCKTRGVYKLLEDKYDWNEEVICQFYATLFIDPAKNDHLHWMTQGVHYEVSLPRFASYFHMGAVDKNQEIMSNENIMEESAMAFMYDEPHPRYYGTTNGLLNYYFYMNRILRLTLAPKGGYATNIVGLSRNVLARFKPDATNFCVMDFIINEILTCSMDTRRQLPYAPYIMKMIEKETGLVFEKECKHQPVRIRVQHPQRNFKKNLDAHAEARDKAAAAAQASAPVPPDPSAPSSSTPAAPPAHYSPRPSSPIVSFLKSIFNVCRNTAVDVHENKKRTKKIVRMLKEDRRAQGCECSPDGSEYEEDEPPVFENPFGIYEEAYNRAHPPVDPSPVSLPSGSDDDEEDDDDEAHDDEE